MSLISPVNSVTLQNTYYGEIPYTYPVTSSVMSQKLNNTYYGQIVAGNDFILTGAVTSSIKTAYGLALADIKTGTGLAKADIKTMIGISNV